MGHGIGFHSRKSAISAVNYRLDLSVPRPERDQGASTHKNMHLQSNPAEVGRGIGLRLE